MSNSIAYPRRTKVIIVVVLIIGIGGFVAAGLTAETDVPEEAQVSGEGADSGSDGDDGDTVSTIANGVESLSPGRGDQAFAQERVTIDLAPGWTGELAFRSGSADAVPLPDDEVEVTELDELIFQPGEGKTFERLPTGRLCVEATIWDQVRGRSSTERVETWCFQVT